MIETAVLALLIASVLHLVRSRRRLIAHVWRQATLLERCALVLALAPIPGPVDEIVGALVIRRVLVRAKGLR